MLRGGNALSVPSSTHSGELKYGAKTSEDLKSHNSLQRLMQFLEQEFTEHINWEQWKKAAAEKVFFDSNIPQGYGVGSSAAVLSAILHEFGKNIPTETLALKELLGNMEGFFHGKSSGLDALVCYLQKAVEIKQGKISIGQSPQQFISEQMQLIDSKQNGLTAEMVSTFKSQPTEFYEAFDKEYVGATNSAIEALNADDRLAVFEASKTLSSFVFGQMQWAIPQSLKPIWEEGLQSDKFCLKLCGSGGGGFAMKISNSS